MKTATDAFVYCFYMINSFPCEFYKHVYLSVELLVKHGLDVSERNNYGESLLTEYLKYTTEIKESLVNKDINDVLPFLKKTIGCLIYGGADIHHRTDENDLPFTVFTERLSLNYVWYSGFYRRTWLMNVTENLLKSVCLFLKFMDIQEAREVLERALSYLDSIDKHREHLELRKLLKETFRNTFSALSSLTTICLVKVWKCAGKGYSELDMPEVLKDSIKEMLYITF